MSRQLKPLVYLADLTHTGLIVSAPYHPLGIGLIAAYMRQELDDAYEIELFKYPDDLSAALERRTPDIVGFANYSWNCNLAHAYATRIKQRHPKTTVVFGGPNYGEAPEEIESFWSRCPNVDLHVIREGETAMVEILRLLEEHDFDFDAIRRARAPVPSCDYMADGELVRGKQLPRIRDLNALPSPYLEGLMDKFFDGKLIPLIHTTRGCPFKCTFCTEGAAYYNKVVKRYDLEDELDYIGQRVGDVPELMISDANFGMFKEDIPKAEAIARTQDKYGWPQFIHVNGGKNQKERLMNVASILKGRMTVSAALQTTDTGILENIRRSNISYGELATLGRESQKINARAYVELILGLPGDNRPAHVKSIRDAVMTDISNVRMYQLILLPNTEMNSGESRRKYGLETKFRIMPRSFGRYRLYGDDLDAVELEEICIAHDTLSFEDYMYCRELHLTVEIIHNGNVFRELCALCHQLGISWADVVERFHNRRRDFTPGIAALYDGFREDNLKGLWDTPAALVKDVSARMDEYLADSQGTNEISKAKAIAWSRLQEEIHDALYDVMDSVLDDQSADDARLHEYLEQLRRFSWYRKHDLLNTREAARDRFDFDFVGLMQKGYLADPMEYHSDRPLEIVFEHDPEQERLIRGYVHEYGDTIDGFGRILMLAPVQRMFRHARAARPTEHAS